LVAHSSRRGRWFLRAQADSIGGADRDATILDNPDSRKRGQVLESPNELVELLTRQGRTGDRIVTFRIPGGDHPLVWTLLMGLLVAEWILPRRRGLA
jgi:hypothetical protein